MKEAVEAAFAQTYSPLEIVLSDAGSEDASFEVMRRMADSYRGPHKLILNRMPSRKAIGGHLNRVMEISQGELVFCAAADDVSLPNRTEVIYEAWENSGRKATSVHSDYIQIDAAGAVIPQILEREPMSGSSRFREQQVRPLDFARTLQPVVFGCTHAYARNLSPIFGNLPEDMTHEDDALAFRSVLGGKIVYVNEPLVKYRVHGNNVYLGTRGRTASWLGLKKEEARLGLRYRNREIMYRGFVADLETARAKSLLARAELAEVEGEVRRLGRRAGLMGRFLQGWIWMRWLILGRLLGQNLAVKDIKILLPRLLPQPVFLGLRLARNYVLARRQAS